MRWLAVAALLALAAVAPPAAAAPDAAPTLLLAVLAPGCDLVWATDPETGESGPREVLDLIVGAGWKDLVVITIDGHQVTATGGHPFWVEGLDAWVDAGDLQAGYQVLSADGAAPSTASSRR